MNWKRSFSLRDLFVIFWILSSILGGLVSFIFQIALIVPDRDLVSSGRFSFLWSAGTEEGTQTRSLTQIFAPDDQNLVYITRRSINSIDYLTGALRWSTKIPEDSLMHFYQDRLFTLDTHDPAVPFAPGTNTNIPLGCKIGIPATMRVYNPHTGEIIWEYSYSSVSLSSIAFENNVVFLQDSINGRRVSQYSPRDRSYLDVDIPSGRILRGGCHDDYIFSQYGHIDLITSTYGPISSKGEWIDTIEEPPFVVSGSKLMMVNRQSRIPVAEIEFSGRPLDSAYVQILVRNDFLVVYLNDSNQFFAFRMK